jgi:hypothetical protein
MENNVEVWHTIPLEEQTFGNDAGWVNFEYSNDNKTIKKVSSKGYCLGVCISKSEKTPMSIELRFDNLCESSDIYLGITDTDKNITLDGISHIQKRVGYIWGPKYSLFLNHGCSSKINVDWEKIKSGDIVTLFFDKLSGEFWVKVNDITGEKVILNQLNEDMKEKMRFFVDFRAEGDQVTII